ncbi:MAG: hypothetical protein GTO63_33150 [Anaerolineae bacterium]|nr:hypothetical protein [Anaerolineae bacterium]NIN99497.1 hypothetical protein [Anaerolineae bacterium]
MGEGGLGVVVGVDVSVGGAEAISVRVGVDDNSTAVAAVGVAAGDATSVEGVDVAGRSGVVGDAVGKTIAGTVGVSFPKSPKTMTPAAMQAAATRTILATPRTMGSRRRSLPG